MKKLTLLKPERKKVFLNKGKGQEVDYLYIHPRLNKDALEKDVKAGAVQFQECLDFLDKKPTRVVLVECENEEEGLMAVSYLAGEYNWKDEINDDDLLIFAADEFEESQYDASDEAKELTLQDYAECEEFRDYDDPDGPEYDPCHSTWEESPYRLPIIPLNELTRYSNFGASVFQENDLFMEGNRNSGSNLPYWLTSQSEPVCIVAEESGGFGWNNQYLDEQVTKEIRRFRNNRHVYVLVVKSRRIENDELDPIDEVLSEANDERTRDTLCELILEYTAGTFGVSCTEEQRKKYYEVLFANWANKFYVKLESRFPKKTMVEQIVEMRNPDKSALIEKVYRYVLSQDGVGNVLKKDDFNVLKKFRSLGMMDSKKDERKTIQKMETDLVGMEDVKRQVQSVVDVMKYNKKRAQMGLGNGGYHNVHLLIGAPGTAKTTIAQMMGNIMKEQNLLPGNRFIAINGADLKGMFVGHSAPKTHRYFEENDIILIDEAYSLTSDKDPDSFSQEALSQLIIELENHGLDRLVLFAGYGGKNVREQDNKMKQFLNANPGIRSRINSTIFFNSYTPEEMVEIVHRQAENQKYILPHEADRLIHDYFAERSKANDFGNGREARSLLENITVKAAMRTMSLPESKLTKKVLQELTIEDVQAAIRQQQESYEQQQGVMRKQCGFRQEG